MLVLFQLAHLVLELLDGMYLLGLVAFPLLRLGLEGHHRGILFIILVIVKNSVDGPFLFLAFAVVNGREDDAL